MDKLLLFLLVTAIGSTLASRYTLLGESIAQSSMKMLKASFDSNPDNLIMSPLSVMILLAVYNLGAGPMAAQTITSLLGGSNRAHTSQLYKELMDTLSQHSPKLLAIANKVYVSHNYRLNNTFVAASRIFHSDTESVDFSQGELIAKMINSWAYEHTRGTINYPMESSDLDPSMEAVLVNAIYFKGIWDLPFNPSETAPQDFRYNKYAANKIPMMHLSTLFKRGVHIGYNVCPELGATMVVLPYKEPGFRMVIVLPDEVDGLSSMLDKILYNGILSYVYEARHEDKVVLSLPKFTIKNRLILNDILVEAGAGAIFQEPAPGIVLNDAVSVSKIFQEAHVEVNEDHQSTAVAITGFPVYDPPPEARGPFVLFTADHPFLYLILYEDKIMFAGTFKH